MMKLINLLSIIAAVMMTACIEDGVDTSPSSQPCFSAESVNIGKVFTEQTTPTARLMVYNRHDKLLNISRIAMRSGNGTFRLNVDGAAGREFHDVELRPGDSIYILVNATLPANRRPELTEVTDFIDFETNGVTTSVTVTAQGQDVVRRRAETVSTDTRWDATYPIQLFDSLIVAEGATLTLPAGSMLHFHDKAYLRVKGSIVTEGTPQQPVTLTGDRLGNVVGNIPFDLMASQWEGVIFNPRSTGNTLSHTIISNTVNGVFASMESAVKFVNCRLRNSAGYALQSTCANLTLIGCEVADAGAGAMMLSNGSVNANHCTFANYYLFSAPIATAVIITGNGAGFTFDNCILFGMGKDVTIVGNTVGYTLFRNCLFKSQGTDDEHFVNSLWGCDPMFATERENYKFDYRLLPGSPAIGTADPQLTHPEAHHDLYGTPRGPAPSIGAYN